MHAPADEFLLIDTPENVVFGYEVAGIGSRFLAALVDSLLIGGLLLVVFITAGTILNALNTWDAFAAGGERATAFILAASILLAFSFTWGYYVFFELLWNGQSPGKRWVGLRVLGTQGQPIGISEAVIRNLVRLIDLLPGTYAVGIITMFVNDQSRRLGDFAAGTLVVYDRGLVSLEMLGRRSQQRPLLRPDDQFLTTMAGLPLERLEEEDLILIDSFLDRYHHLANRSSLAEQLITHLFSRMSVPSRPAPATEVPAFLQAIVYLKRMEDRKPGMGYGPPETAVDGGQNPGIWTGAGPLAGGK